MGWTRLQAPKLQKRLRLRARITQLIREFFIKEGFLEVETPILVAAAGQEPYLNPIKVALGDERGRRGSGYLITSPEYAHKKLLAAGFKKTFEITRAFRSGEPWGGLHNPEFTMLEWYRAGADYFDIMRDIERMVQYVMRGLCKKSRGNFQFSISNFQKNSKPKYPISNIEYQGKVIDLSSPWQRLTMRQAWQRYAKLSLPHKTHDREFYAEACRSRGYTIKSGDTWEDLFFKIFLTEIEPKLGFPKPTILYEYPAQMAALARIKTSRHESMKAKPSPSLRPPSPALTLPSPLGRGDGGEGKWAERFELYIAGIELANAFSELTDAAEQRKRFIEEQQLRKKFGKEPIPLDEDFLDAVGHMPPAAGIAFGVDRLAMLLTNAKTIEDVLAFPAREMFDTGYL